MNRFSSNKRNTRQF